MMKNKDNLYDYMIIDLKKTLVSADEFYISSHHDGHFILYFTQREHLGHDLMIELYSGSTFVVSFCLLN